MTTMIKHHSQIHKKLERRILKNVGKALEDFSMIENGDRVMVCLSGGKDSYTLLEILSILQKKAPIDFDVIAVNLDQKQPEFPVHVLPEYLDKKGIPFLIYEEDTYSTVKRVIPEGKTMCSLCSRLRRRLLYKAADKVGANKIALGHHRDDLLETFFLNLFHGGKLATMPPKLKSDDEQYVVIRPLAYVHESEIVTYAEWKQFPIIPCNLCGSQENLQRKKIKQMLALWKDEYPNRLDVMFASLKNVNPSHLVDRELYDFNEFEPKSKYTTGISEAKKILDLTGSSI